MPADYHSHTPLCHHAVGTPEAFVDAAIAAGVTEYGVSDHAPEPGPFDDWRMAENDLPAYFEWIETAKAYAADRLPVRAGLECDWLPGCEEWVEAHRSSYAWDYLIGSVHYLGDWNFDGPTWAGHAAAQDPERAWTQYWDAYREMARSGLFDLLGHPDLIKKFGLLPTGDLRRFYEPAIADIAASGCAIEINTAGWHKPCQEQYPAEPFLQLAAEAGIPLSISSDAHAPEEIGRDFDRAIALALQVGYRETVLFEGRQRSATAL